MLLRNFSLMQIWSEIPILLLTESASAQFSKLPETCKSKFFPFSSGGLEGSETVACTIYDEANGFILVAGTSNSADYVGSSEDHGFVYALDMDGNWQWGQYFTAAAKQVSSITGCTLSEDSFVMIGTTQNRPVIIEFSPSRGELSRFIVLDIHD